MCLFCLQMNMTCLAWAAGRGHTDVVKILIQKGAKVNTPDKVGCLKDLKNYSTWYTNDK